MDPKGRLSPFFKEFRPLLPRKPALATYVRRVDDKSHSLSDDWSMLHFDDEEETVEEKVNAYDNLQAHDSDSRFRFFIGELTQPVVNIELLRAKSKDGIPSKVRPSTWPLLLGYWPAESRKRNEEIKYKREAYKELVVHWLTGKIEYSEDEMKLIKQIKVDIPRTSSRGYVSLFRHPRVQTLLQNVLYIWSLQNPDVLYFQGLNDLCTPFIIVMLSSFADGELRAVNANLVNRLSPDILQTVEADVYWCLTNFLKDMKPHYGLSNLGLQALIRKLEEVVQVIDEPMYIHLKNTNIDFLFFAVRWMICLLIRELSMENVIRLWDTYMSKGPRCSPQYHVQVCAAFMTFFSEQLQKKDFSKTMMFLQQMPDNTLGWGEKEIEELIERTEIVTRHWNIHSSLSSLICAILVAIIVAVLLVVMLVSLLVAVLLYGALVKQQRNRKLVLTPHHHSLPGRILRSGLRTSDLRRLPMLPSSPLISPASRPTSPPPAPSSTSGIPLSSLQEETETDLGKVKAEQTEASTVNNVLEEPIEEQTTDAKPEVVPNATTTTSTIAEEPKREGEGK